MRYSPTGSHIVMERGQNAADGPRRIEVMDVTTGAVATFPSGYNPRWLTADQIVAESPDGSVGESFVAGFKVRYVPANRGQLDANGAGAWAVSDLMRTTFTVANGDVDIVEEAREPRLSALATLVVRDPDDGLLRLYSGPELGPCEDSRWSSETLVWWLGGRVWGRTTPDQPTVELRLAGRSLSHPAPFWYEEDASLWVALEIGDGELALCEWSDLTEGRAQGYRLGRSDGAGFDLDCAPGATRHEIRVCYFDPLGAPVRVTVDTREPMVSLEKPVDPPPPPDIEWTTDPHGVVEDIASWLFAPNQGPDVHLSPDATIRFYCKSDELSGDGPHPEIGEHWDRDAQYIGHLEDASTGRRILDGKEVIAEDIVRMFPDTHAQVWAGLKLNRNTFADGRRLWLPRRCVSGTRIKYVTDITWTVPPRETPHTRVWQNIPIEIRVDVGYARIRGKEVRVRGAYIPDGHPEVNYYAPPAGFNAWVAGPFGTFDSEWM
jgi:hypothetical protein